LVEHIFAQMKWRLARSRIGLVDPIGFPEAEGQGKGR